MASTAANAAASADDSQEIEVDVPGFFRIYKDGHLLRFIGTDKLPAALDPATGVDSKDITIDPTTGVSVRLYLPPVAAGQKLPLLVYFHGGAFCLESSASPAYHRHLNSLSALTPLIGVSVDYRLAPEHPIPAAYEDSWTSLLWVLSLPDPWLSDHADLNRVFIAGDSAGANICHHMALRARVDSAAGVILKGVALIHPYFWGSEPIGSESTDPAVRSTVEKLWQFVCPNSTGPDDPRINPLAVDAANLALLGCDQLLVTVAEKDTIKHRGKAYYEKVKQSGWEGKAELVETPDSEHVFHLFNPDTDKAKEMTKLLADFFNKE
ncbi:probable carboxylesterase 2 [Dendrobium catenatum]|uniref:Putative carboxylesterase 2 n=1 Tax=Dendrobium catenatum TaxID=906689 RepID=A0A2I0WIN6_9ASPA|nr:probable carboxylesterase 2 [Dendrobium catenatum]PKU75526.1 putative carboxylesterase 2 [Dendrobium catenatum]